MKKRRPPLLAQIALLLLALPLLPTCGAAADAVEPAARDTASDSQSLETLLATEQRGFPPGTPPTRQAAFYIALSEAWAERVDLIAENLESSFKPPVAAKAEAASAAEHALAAAQRATALAPQSARAHLAVAVACGKRTDYVDNSTKMALSRQIRDEAKLALSLNPREELAHHILGRWNYGFATINPVLKLAARVVYGTLPAASLEAARDHLEQAAALNPQRLATHQHLALIYKATGEKEQATRHWKIVLQLPATDAEDRAAQQEARQALK